MRRLFLVFMILNIVNVHADNSIVYVSNEQELINSFNQDNSGKIIRMINNIEIENTIEISNYEWIFDLNGYNVVGKDNKSLFQVNSGILSIVDSNSNQHNNIEYQSRNNSTDVYTGGMITGFNGYVLCIDGGTVNLSGGCLYKNGGVAYLNKGSIHLVGVDTQCGYRGVLLIDNSYENAAIHIDEGNVNLDGVIFNEKQALDRTINAVNKKVYIHNGLITYDKAMIDEKWIYGLVVIIAIAVFFVVKRYKK